MDYVARKRQLQLEFWQTQDRLNQLRTEQSQLEITLQQLVGKTALLNELIEEEKKEATPPRPSE